MPQGVGYYTVQVGPISNGFPGCGGLDGGTCPSLADSAGKSSACVFDKSVRAGYYSE